jgi:predicted DsbA family dithiol-disulfide isomerase
VNIEIWSDLICPFCGIGNHRLNRALASFPHRDEVTIVHRSFQLDPNFPTGEVQSSREMLKAKYGMSDAQIEANNGRLEATARAEGLDPYIVTENRIGNTGLTHEFLAFASENGIESEAWELLYRNYFGEMGDIFTVDALVELGARLGLDIETTRAVLTDHRYANRVRADGEEAQRFGATGVPFIVLDRRYAVVGAQPLETFEAALQTAWQESHPTLVTVGADEAGDAPVCGPDGCPIS